MKDLLVFGVAIVLAFVLWCIAEAIAKAIVKKVQADVKATQSSQLDEEKTSSCVDDGDPSDDEFKY